MDCDDAGTDGDGDRGLDTEDTDDWAEGETERTREYG